MENTIENKIKFVSNYIQQEVIVELTNDKYPMLFQGIDYIGNIQAMDKGINLSCYHRIFDISLLLTPLSQITDEDKIWIIKNVHYSHVKFENPSPLHLWNDKWMNLDSEPFETVDYLRLKGYALPFMGLSVEQQFEYGWVKLKTL